MVSSYVEGEKYIDCKVCGATDSKRCKGLEGQELKERHTGRWKIWTKPYKPYKKKAGRKRSK